MYIFMSSQNSDIDYSHLRALLATKNWQAADRETLRIMLRLSGLGEKRWLTEPEISNFCCEDLRIIDQLWLQSSDNRFGFSAQKKIYQRSPGDWCAFGKSVGWLIAENTFEKPDWIWAYPYLGNVHSYDCSLWYDRLTFDLDAPTGHLPVLVDHLWLEFDLVNESLVLPYWIDNVRGKCLFDRLEACDISMIL
jgi:hypothetical protein